MNTKLELLEAKFKSIRPPAIERIKRKVRRAELKKPQIKHPKANVLRSKEAASTVVTVTSPFWSKSFVLCKIKRRVLISFTAFLLLFLGFGSFGLLFLSSESLQMSRVLEATKRGYAELLQKNRGLQEFVDSQMEQKAKEESAYSLLSIKSESIEEPVLDISKISVEQKIMLLKNIPNGSPVVYLGVTSEYGSRNHPVLGKSIFHEGIDLKAESGTKIYSAADGIVEVTKYNGGYGNMLLIRHAYGFSSVYGHLSRFAVKPGDFVRKGQLVAYSGNTGLTAGPHLHYEVRFLGEPLNPAPFISWDYDKFYTLFEKEKKIRWASLVEATRWQMQVEHLSSLTAQK